MGTPNIMTAQEIIKRLRADGWTLKSISGSHHVFVKPGRGILTIPAHGHKDIKPGLLNAIFKQAGWKK